MEPIIPLVSLPRPLFSSILKKRSVQRNYNPLSSCYPLHKPEFCKYTNFMVPIHRFLWVATKKTGLKILDISV